MRKTLLVVAGLVAAAVFANQAFATATTDPANGWIQVCKQSAAAPNNVIGNFRFEITPSVGSDIFVIVPVGLCSAPIQVAAGDVTVTELGSDTAMHANGTTGGTPDGSPDFTSFLSTTASAVGLSGPTGVYDPTTMSYTVTVPPSSDQSKAVTVTFTNALVTGVIEVCKQIVSTSGLSGTWTYTVTGSNGFIMTTQPVAIGACTSPITVPAGFVKVVETGDNAENVTAITATKTASNSDAVVGPNPTAPKYDLPTATVVASVDAGDASNQTIVTYTNNSVRLKLCKSWDPMGMNIPDPAAATGYPFAFTYSGPAGPNSGPASLNLVAGTELSPNCVLVGGPYRAGTQVVVTEGIVPGTKVDWLGDSSPGITVNPTGNAVPGTASDANRTVTVTLGAGETVVSFEDVPALRGTLKICKAVTTTPPLIPAGTIFSFTVAPVAPTTGVPLTVLVPSGQCVIVGTFAFNSTWTVTEAAAPNITVSAITAVPGFVVVLENGLPVNSNEPVLTGTSTATRSTNVTIGENNITELTFTNTDPPAATTGGSSSGSTGGSTGSTGSTSSGSTSSGSTAGSTSSGSTSSGSTSSGSTSSGSTSSGGSSSGGGGAAPATSITAALTPTPIIGTSLGLGSSAGSKTATAAELKLGALLTKLRTELAVNKATLKKLVAQKAAAKTLARKHLLAKRIAAIQLADRKLAKQIMQLS